VPLATRVARRYKRPMSSREHEHLDIYEMERMVARALIALVDDRETHHRITPKLLASRSGLPLRRVREVTNEWNLQTLSGDEYWLGPGSVDRVRELLQQAPKSHGA
jgi:hypothetical protein